MFPGLSAFRKPGLETLFLVRQPLENIARKQYFLSNFSQQTYLIVQRRFVHELIFIYPRLLVTHHQPNSSGNRWCQGYD